MREGVTLLGITTTPLWIWKRIQSCAGLLPYFLPISSNLGSSKRAGSSGFAQGRSGDPRGLYAVTDDRKKEQYWSAGSITKNWDKQCTTSQWGPHHQSLSLFQYHEAPRKVAIPHPLLDGMLVHHTCWGRSTFPLTLQKKTFTFDDKDN